MRSTIAILFLSLNIFAQDAKVKSEPSPSVVSSERELTELEITKIQLTTARIELLQKKYDIAGYQKEAQPITAEQEAIVTAACVSIGIPAEKVRSECGVNLGGVDGKPSRVWWNRPAKPDKESK